MNTPNTDTNEAQQPASDGCMARLVRLDFVSMNACMMIACFACGCSVTSCGVVCLNAIKNYYQKEKQEQRPTRQERKQLRQSSLSSIAGPISIYRADQSHAELRELILASALRFYRYYRANCSQRSYRHDQAYLAMPHAKHLELCSCLLHQRQVVHSFLANAERMHHHPK